MTNQRYVYPTASSSAAPFHSTSQRQSTVFSINGSNINHANLRRHLSPEEQQLHDPPPLIRQGAFMFDDSIDPICRICYGVTEDYESSHFIRPCQCRGPINGQHHHYPLLQPPSQPQLPPIHSSTSSSSTHHHPSLLPPSPHQEFHDIPSSDNHNNNNINNNPPHLYLHSGNVHDECLKNWMTSTGANTTTCQKCNTCLHDYTFPPSLQQQQKQHCHHHPSTTVNPSTLSTSSSSSSSNSRSPALFSLPVLSASSAKKRLHMEGLNHFTRLRCVLYTMGLLVFLSLGSESIRCTEIRKVSGAEIDDSPEAPLGRPDYIWLPIVDWECWRASYIGQGWSFLYYLLGQPYSTIFYFTLCISLIYLIVTRFYHMPSTTR